MVNTTVRSANGEFLSRNYLLRFQLLRRWLLVALTHQLVELVALGRESEAEVTAIGLLQYDRNDSNALDVLTEVDLLQLLTAGRAVVDDENAPEPVKVVKFDMFGQVDAGQDVILTLATEAGPADDTSGDWAGWENPRIVRIPSPRTYEE